MTSWSTCTKLACTRHSVQRRTSKGEEEGGSAGTGTPRPEAHGRFNLRHRRDEANPLRPRRFSAPLWPQSCSILGRDGGMTILTLRIAFLTLCVLGRNAILSVRIVM